jgi:hypothetical protein
VGKVGPHRRRREGFCGRAPRAAQLLGTAVLGSLVAAGIATSGFAIERSDVPLATSLDAAQRPGMGLSPEALAPWTLEKLAPWRRAGSADDTPPLRLAGHLKSGSTQGVSATAAPAGFGGVVSGLPWASGSTVGAEFGTWRGRPQDVYNMFSGRTNWADVKKFSLAGATKSRAQRPGRLSIGLAMMTEEQRFQHARCATGENDQHIREIATNLVSIGAGDAVIRLGWEKNGRGFPWSVGNVPENVPAYRKCFRRLAMIIRSVAPDMLIEWTPRKGTYQTLYIDSLYPGDEFVDVIGLLYYDMWPDAPTEAEWQRGYMERDRHGGPKGLGTWLEFAQQHGKPLALAEWAVSSEREDKVPFDNPLFIQKMYEFFRENAGSIAYETYFNSLYHQIYNPNGAPRNPLSSARYRALYSAGM